MLRLSLVTLAAVSKLAAVVHADVAETFGDVVAEAAEAVAGDDSTAPTPAVDVPLPKFTPVTLGAPFYEQFSDDGWQKRWKESRKTTADEAIELNYNGRWAVEEPTELKGMEGDAGLVLKDDARRHAISSIFKKPIDNKGKSLVVQYEVKMQKLLECGGAYLKLLTDSPKGIDAEEFSGDTPYTIMFGPDKCGSTNKVHFIFRHKNPITGEFEEKHLINPPSARITKVSTLYTLIVNPDQTYVLKINDEEVKSGSLLEDFTPAVNPDKEIPDTTDVKPEDWVDEAKIDDPEATKPEDWDEDAPLEILDPEDVKPADWHDDEPATIPDPDAKKPEDWDDEEDGTWIPPQVDNPKCTSPGGSGCGEWKQKTIRNPDYKGKWYAPKIDNPLYKGVWEPRKIANPDYYEDKSPADFTPMSGIGFELWTMQADILFDNILVSHDVADAAELAKQWKLKFDYEDAVERAATEADSQAAQKNYDQLFPTFAKDPIGFIKQQVTRFITIASYDPIEAVKTMPQIAGGLLASLITLFVIIGTTLGLFAAKAAPAAKAKAKDATAAAGPQNPVQLKEKKSTDAANAKDGGAALKAGEATVSGTDTDAPAAAAEKVLRSRKA